jgi:hypothetical protein
MTNLQAKERRGLLRKELMWGRVWLYMSVIPATQKAEIGRSLFEASPGKSVGPDLKSTLKAKGLQV